MKAHQMRKAKGVYSWLVIARESGIIAFILAETQEAGRGSGKLYSGTREGFRHALLEAVGTGNCRWANERQHPVWWGRGAGFIFSGGQQLVAGYQSSPFWACCRRAGLVSGLLLETAVGLPTGVICGGLPSWAGDYRWWDGFLGVLGDRHGGGGGVQRHMVESCYKDMAELCIRGAHSMLVWPSPREISWEENIPW